MGGRYALHFVPGRPAMTDTFLWLCKGPQEEMRPLFPATLFLAESLYKMLEKSQKIAGPSGPPEDLI
jgi:hypothetical protein